MAERVDVLEASHEALKTELADTERHIQLGYQRAEKLRTALEALHDLLGDESAVELKKMEELSGESGENGSVSRTMDKLQGEGETPEKGKSAQAEGDPAAVTAGGEAAKGEAAEGPTPVWLEKKEA